LTIIFVIFLASIIYREILWCKRKKEWKEYEGVVISHQNFKGEVTHAKQMVIEFYVNKVRHEHESSYVLYLNKIGTKLRILYDDESEKSVLFTRRHRWIPTIVLIGFSLPALLMTLATVS